MFKIHTHPVTPPIAQPNDLRHAHLSLTQARIAATLPLPWRKGSASLRVLMAIFPSIVACGLAQSEQLSARKFRRDLRSQAHAGTWVQLLTLKLEAVVSGATGSAVVPLGAGRRSCRFQWPRPLPSMHSCTHADTRQRLEHSSPTRPSRLGAARSMCASTVITALLMMAEAAAGTDPGRPTGAAQPPPPKARAHAKIPRGLRHAHVLLTRQFLCASWQCLAGGRRGAARRGAALGPAPRGPARPRWISALAVRRGHVAAHTNNERRKHWAARREHKGSRPERTDRRRRRRRRPGGRDRYAGLGFA